MKNILCLFLLMTTFVAAQNYFPFKEGDALLYQEVHSNGIDANRGSYTIVELDTTIEHNGNYYVKYLDNIYYYNDTINNVLHARGLTGNDVLIDFNLGAGSSVSFPYYSYWGFTVQPQSSEYLLGRDRSVFSLKYFDGNEASTLNFADSIGISFLYSMLNYGPGLYSRDYTYIKQIRHKGKFTPEHLLNIEVADSLITYIHDYPQGSSITLKSEITPDESFGTSFICEVILVSAIGEIKDSVIKYHSSGAPYVYWYTPETEIETGDTLKYRFSGIDIGLNPTRVWAPESGFAKKIIESVTSIGIYSIDNPGGFSLKQNYPNPFNPVTNIKYELETESYVLLEVFDITGVKIATLVHNKQFAGKYSATFDANKLSSGIYFYRINITDKSGKPVFSAGNKMLLLK